MTLLRTALPSFNGFLAAAAVAFSTFGCAEAESQGVASAGRGGAGGSVDTGHGGGVGSVGNGGGAAAVGGAGGQGGCTAGDECAALTTTCAEGACVNGQCSTIPANEGMACDDGKFCTIGDKCTA